MFDMEMKVRRIGYLEARFALLCRPEQEEKFFCIDELRAEA